jgi:hypothetical protein
MSSDRPQPTTDIEAAAAQLHSELAMRGCAGLIGVSVTGQWIRVSYQAGHDPAERKRWRWWRGHEVRWCEMSAVRRKR